MGYSALHDHAYDKKHKRNIEVKQKGLGLYFKHDAGRSSGEQGSTTQRTNKKNSFEHMVIDENILNAVFVYIPWQ